MKRVIRGSISDKYRLMSEEEVYAAFTDILDHCVDECPEIDLKEINRRVEWFYRKGMGLPAFEAAWRTWKDTPEVG